MITILVNRNGNPTTWTLRENGEDLGYQGTGYLTGEPPSVRRMVREALRRGGYQGAAERVLDDSPVDFVSSMPLLNLCKTKKCLSFAMPGKTICPSCLRVTRNDRNPTVTSFVDCIRESGLVERFTCY